MIVKDKGIVIHHIPYSDTSIIAKVLTKEKGYIGFLIQGIRSQKSKNKLSFFHQLSILDLVFYHKDNLTLNKISEVKPSIFLPALHDNPIKNTLLLFISELLYKTLKEGYVNQDLFCWIENEIIELNYLAKTKGFILRFLTGYLDHLGLKPENYTDLQQSVTFIIDTDRVALVDRYFKDHLIQESYTNQEHIYLQELVISMFQYHFDSMRNFESYQMLKEIFFE